MKRTTSADADAHPPLQYLSPPQRYLKPFLLSRQAVSLLKRTTSADAEADAHKAKAAVHLQNLQRVRIAKRQVR